MSKRSITWSIVFAAFGASTAVAAPHATETIVLGPFTGHYAPLHKENASLQPEDYYGTDLGWSYRYQNRIQFLFGDTQSLSGATIDPQFDDVFGSVDLTEWPDPRAIRPGHVPPLRLAMSAPRKLATLDPGEPMEVLKTPVAGFSDGVHEYALFVTGKPQVCSVDNDCGSELSCDVGLGFVGSPPQHKPGLTLACAAEWPGCVSSKTVGLCTDHTSSLRSDSDYGRVSSVAWRQVFGVRSGPDSGQYTHTQSWVTNKFINVAARAVTNFSAAKDAKHSVLLWGRPEFVGVNEKHATLAMYFAYAPMPTAPDFTWRVRYFSGLDASGNPRFTEHERDAAPLDLDAARAGVQAEEAVDIVQHMSIVWIETLHKWLMLYGGGVSRVPIPQIAPNCGVLEVFARNECRHVHVGNGAIRMRIADQPWGPWTSPLDVFVGGDSDARPVADQYASGGVLHHPACVGEHCESASPHALAGDYGWLYGANIIEEWIRPAGKGVDIIWNASTWNPYRVILLRTHIEP